jgi:SAM-dependent methyltransferase
MSDPSPILAHHERAASIWGLGGENYEEVSYLISDALAHAAQRLNAKPGAHVLDVGTGTGWSARNVARAGAHVTAVDISAELLEAAKNLSSHVRPQIDFQLADAERLPFPDGRFDGVISTFGVMFAANQEQAAAELGRVCRRGGRLSLSVWAASGSVAEFFAVLGKYSDAPAPAASPLAWGDTEHARKLLGGDFDLTFEDGVSHSYYDAAEEVWDRYKGSFGPVRHIIDSLEPERLTAYRNDFIDLHRQYEVEAGLHVKREYLIIVGTRR